MSDKRFSYSILAFCCFMAACSPSDSDDVFNGDGWELVEETDKFNDRTKRSVQKAFVQDNVRITLEIRCDDRGVGYKATAFDADENGLEFRTTSGIGYYGNAYNNTRALLRFDDLDALSQSSPVQEYTNQTNILLKFEKLAATQAKSVLLRLNFIDRMVDLEFDQSLPAIQQVLKPCADSYQQKADQAKAEQEQQRSDATANLEAQYEDDDIPSDILKWRLENSDVSIDEDRLARKTERENDRQAKADAEVRAKKQAQQDAIDAQNAASEAKRQRRLEETRLRNAEAAARSAQAQRDAENHLKELERISNEQIRDR